MNAEYRQSLVALLARLDRVVAEADAIMDRPGDVELGVLAEDLREFTVEMRAKVEAKLERGQP